MQLLRLKSLLLSILLGIALLLWSMSPVLSAPLTPQLERSAQESVLAPATQNPHSQDAPATPATTPTVPPEQQSHFPQTAPQPSPSIPPSSIKGQEPNESDRLSQDRSYDLEAIQQFNRDVYETP